MWKVRRATRTLWIRTAKAHKIQFSNATAWETSKIVDLQQHGDLKLDNRALNRLFAINKSREIAQGSGVRADSNLREREKRKRQWLRQQ